jgi:hypothetical protein
VKRTTWVKRLYLFSPTLWPTSDEIHDEVEGVLGRRGEIDEALVDHLREAEEAWQASCE